MFCICSLVDENLREHVGPWQAGRHEGSVFHLPPWVPPLSPSSQALTARIWIPLFTPKCDTAVLRVFQSLPAPDPAEVPGRFGQSDGAIGAEPFPEEPADPCERSKESECESFTFSALLCPERDALLLCEEWK